MGLVKIIDLAKKAEDLRKYLGFQTAAEFGRALGIAKQTASQLENKGIGFTTERIQQIVDTWDIDARYFFGQIDNIEDADINKRNGDKRLSHTEQLVNQVHKLTMEIENIKDKISPTKELDVVTDRVRVNPDLRSVVKLFYTKPLHVLEGIKAIIVYYLNFKESEKKEREAQAG